MTYEPSDVMVEAAARVLFAKSCGGMLPDYIWDARVDNACADARAALRAAFAAAIEAGEARKGFATFLIGDTYHDSGCIILRTQEGEK